LKYLLLTLFLVATCLPLIATQPINQADASELLFRLIPAGTVVLGIGLAFLGTIISVNHKYYQDKSNIIASARIAWMQELRREIATLIVNINIVKDYLSVTNGEEEDKSEAPDEVKTALKDIRGGISIIKLYLNPKEHDPLIKKVEEYFELTFSDENKDRRKAYSAFGELITESQDVLKQVWEQAKTETGKYH
jgi:hypothetical protein